MRPDVSIIIPTKDGGRTIERVLAAIESQQAEYAFEVIAVDSGSTDMTLEILVRHNVRLYQIRPEEFSHSRTRNFGASHSNATKYLIFINQDAIPSDELWLENMVKSIEYEEDIKAACATEIIEGLDYFNVSGVAMHAIRSSMMEGIYVIEPHLIRKTAYLPKVKQRELFPFTTVCAIFDKEHFETFPFDVNFLWGEDLAWAVQNSNNGFKSALSSLAKVYHFHNYKRLELLEIGEVATELCRVLFGMKPTWKGRVRALELALLRKKQKITRLFTPRGQT